MVSIVTGNPIRPVTEWYVECDFVWVTAVRMVNVPVLLGTGNGTRLVEHGQRITVDGDRELVTILEDAVRGH